MADQCNWLLDEFSHLTPIEYKSCLISSDEVLCLFVQMTLPSFVHLAAGRL